MKLSLSNGRRVMTSISFVCPDDDVIKMSDSEEVFAQATAETGRSTMTVDEVDAVIGIVVHPVAQLTVFDGDESVESVVTMSKDDVRRLIYDLRAVYETMDDAAAIADRTWSRYRRQVRLESTRADAAEGEV